MIGDDDDDDDDDEEDEDDDDDDDYDDNYDDKITSHHISLQYSSKLIRWVVRHPCGKIC
jgi:hypothetical protein